MNMAKWLLSAFHSIRPAGHTGRREPYTGDELRAIRKRNGVGRPPAVRLAQEAHTFHKWCRAAAGSFGLSFRAYRERVAAEIDAQFYTESPLPPVGLGKLMREYHD